LLQHPSQLSGKRRDGSGYYGVCRRVGGLIKRRVGADCDCAFRTLSFFDFSYG
jgi:hypothetical protein